MTREDALSFPLDVWGTVRRAPEEGTNERIQVVRADGGGYLIFTIENGAEYDVWLEALEDVEAYLRALDVVWDAVVSRHG